MNPTILGLYFPGFLNQAPALALNCDGARKPMYPFILLLACSLEAAILVPWLLRPAIKELKGIVYCIMLYFCSNSVLFYHIKFSTLSSITPSSTISNYIILRITGLAVSVSGLGIQRQNPHSCWFGVPNVGLGGLGFRV